MSSLLRICPLFLFGLIITYQSYSSEINIVEPGQQQNFACLAALRSQIKNFEDKGQFLRAAQEMDRLIKLSNKPLINDLCYALDLNRRTDLADRQKRAQTIMQQISKHLAVTEQQEEVTININGWGYLRPYLEMLLTYTAQNPSFESRGFRYKIVREDFKEYFSWRTKKIRESLSPISISGTNIRCEGERVDGVYAVYYQLLHLSNSTQKDEEARKDFSYHFYGGKINESALNPRNFYDLMVRAGFRKEDFKKGTHGFQDKVFVKPVTLAAGTSESISKEFEDTIFSTLKKAKQPYVAFVFGLNTSSPISINELYLNNSKLLNMPEIIATIISTQENRLYLCFYNNARSMLDLHGMSSKEAFEKCTQFIQEKFDNFEHECTIITGRGNHVNAGGSQAVLSKSFKKWVTEPEMKTFVQSIRSISDKGGYKVKLYKPLKLILSGSDEKGLITQISANVLQEDKVGKCRLKISHHEPSKVNLSTLVMRVCMLLFKEHAFSATMMPKIVGDEIHLTWTKNPRGFSLIAPPIHH